MGDSAVRPRLQPGSINWALKREKRLTVTKSESHKNVANADSTEFQKASPTPAAPGTCGDGDSPPRPELGWDPSLKLSPIMSRPEEAQNAGFLLASEAEVPREASGGRGC